LNIILAVALCVGQYNVYLPSVGVPAPQKGVGMPWWYRDCADAQAVGATWQYDWSVDPLTCEGIESVPMFYNSTTGNPKPSRWLLTFNEPDLTGQANLSPQAAAKMYYELTQRYPDRFLVAPAPSDLNPQWLTEWYNEYVNLYGTPPRMDALAVHCYLGTASRCAELTNWYLSLADKWQVGEVWITEFAFCGVTATAEMSQYIDWLQQQNKISRYSWFATHYNDGEAWQWQCNTSLLNNGLTTLGIVYKSR